MILHADDRFSSRKGVIVHVCRLFPSTLIERYNTMQFRPITPAELTAFVTIAGDADRSAAFERQIQSFIANDMTRPQWLWVAEHEGYWRGRVVYTGNRGEATPECLDWLDVVPAPDEMTIAADLIRESLKQIYPPSLHQIEAILDDPSELAGDPQRFATLLTAVGFRLTLDRRKFEWISGDPIPPPSARLVFRTLAEVGDATFIETMARITEGTLDHYTQESVRAVGPLEAARRHFHEEQHYQKRWEPHWWQMGYLPDGQIVGIVMPAENHRWPNIGYIGVIPEQRGHGYVHDLLAHGTRTLIAEGVQRIIADTDVGNVPMANAFLHMGYRQYATRQIWTLTLKPDKAG
jgi:RimJ/RimL family protein N-acetyltransferase